MSRHDQSDGQGRMEILPLCAYDTSFWPHPCPSIAPEVEGVVFECGQNLYISFLVSRRPGLGFVSRYLNSLPTDKTVIFPDVMSPVLRAALLRRGFREVESYAPAFGDWAQSLIREKAEGSSSTEVFL